MARLTISELLDMKRDKKKVVAMTAYDYTTAGIIDRAGVEIILIGDSGGRYLLGHENNNWVTMDEMVLMTRAVSRAAKRAFVIGDMPFMTYQISKEKAIFNSARLIQEGGAQAAKLEVGADHASTVEAIVKAGIPVMGHIGLTPQATIGTGRRDRPADAKDAYIEEDKVWRDARALIAAGAFSLLLTRVPPETVGKMAQELSVLTMVAGAGDGDGRLGVTPNTVGFNLGELDHPRATYGPVAVSLFEAVQKFSDDVKAGRLTRSMLRPT